MLDLLTVDDIAQRLRVARRTVADQWVHRPGFPPPKFAPSPRRRLWLAAEVEAWAARAVKEAKR
jgi:predicted DNA-binding transcriptional regulator AlpA